MMRCVKDVPTGPTCYLAIEVCGEKGVYIESIDLPESLDGAVDIAIEKISNLQGLNPTYSADGFKVFRMMKPLLRDEIESSIRRVQSKKPRTLLTVCNDDVFQDDLSANDYWVVDWKMTMEILRRLEAEP